MFWIIVLIFAGLMGKWYYKDCYDVGMGILCFLMVSMMGAVIGVFGMALCTIEGGEFDREEVINTLDIHSIKNGQEFSGSFFLGIGSIGSSQYYVSYVDVGDGFVQQVKYSTNKPELRRLILNLLELILWFLLKEWMLLLGSSLLTQNFIVINITICMCRREL